MNSHLPTKITTKRTETTWTNKRIKRLHKRKQRAFNTHNRNHASRDQFCKARINAHKETRTAHRRYIASTCSDSAKRFWSYIKSLKVDTIGLLTLTKDHQTESDNKHKADILNNQLKSPTFQKNHTQTYQQCQTLPSQQITCFICGQLGGPNCSGQCVCLYKNIRMF